VVQSGTLSPPGLGLHRLQLEADEESRGHTSPRQGGTGSAGSGNAFSRLASVLEKPRDLAKAPSLSTFVGEERGESLFGLVPDDALLMACRWVGRALDLTIQPQPGAKDWKAQDPLGDIARASRIRTRRVALRGEWWRNDNGPLLVYTEETKHPCALLPTSVGGRDSVASLGKKRNHVGQAYELLDSVEQTRVLVTEKVASILAPFAYTFYTAFPGAGADDLGLFQVRLARMPE